MTPPLGIVSSGDLNTGNPKSENIHKPDFFCHQKIFWITFMLTLQSSKSRVMYLLIFKVK